ncbi:MAG: hypothetical protein VW270_13785, partial [Candidatus Poseidoniales archaeon]
MPTYLVRNKKTKKVEEMFMGISEMENYIKDNPNMELAPATPAIVSGVASARMKPDQGFRDVLRNIKKRNPRSNINTW